LTYAHCAGFNWIVRKRRIVRGINVHTTPLHRLL